MSILVKLENASVSFQGNKIIDSAVLDITSEECIRIAGGNGTGKTTFLRLVKGDQTPDTGIGCSRIYCFNGEQSPSPIHAAKHVRIVSPRQQDEYRIRGWNLTGREVVVTGIDDTPLLYHDPDQMELARADEIISWLDIGNLSQKSILRMSRGEGRKILIARALVSTPQLLLLDEFLHELDMLSRRDVMVVIEKAFHRGIGILYTSHRDEETLPSTTRTLFLENGKLVDRKNVPAVDSSAPNAEFILSENDSVSGMILGKETLLTVKNCSIYQNDTLILRDLEFSMNASQNWAVIGSNGSGKSTFIKMLYGLILPSVESTVERFGVYQGDPLSNFRLHAGYISSELQTTYDREMRCVDVVASGFYSSIGIYEPLSDSKTSAAMDFLTKMNLSPFAGREFGTLSYGEQRKVLFARALIHKPFILFLDEPFTGIDSAIRTWMIQMLESLAGKQFSMMIAVHHAEDIPKSVTHILHIERGRISFAGPIAEFPLGPFLSGV
jgi:molybdate transport system ATP-binding protein